VRIQIGVRSDVGLAREINEDAYLIDDPLFVVADGMGGHVAGDVASSTAVGVIADEFAAADVGNPDSLIAMLRRANSVIWQKAQSNPSLRGMGTTCTLLAIQDSQAHLAHVGDSRAYLLRDGELSQLTEDHTLVGRMVREGRLSQEEAEHHPQRNIIMRVLGGDSDVEVDILSLDLAPDDQLLLCSDGLTSMIGADLIRQTLEREADAQAAADRLVQLANKAGGEDNITAVVIHVRDSEGPPPPPRRSEASAPVPKRSPPPETSASVGAEATGRTAVKDAPRQPVRPFPRRARGVAIGLAVVALLGVAGFFLIQSLLDNSYFVGVNDAGEVTIYRGRPEEIAGFSLRREEAGTNLALSDLPEFMRDDLQEGIKAESLEDAEQRVADLKDRAKSFGDEGATTKKSPQ
jgi:serine/threonine protein phosphatase PrpC